MIREWHDGQNIVLADMPKSVSECVTLNEDGSYTIVINEGLSEEKRYLAYQHALKHIERDDFTEYDVQRVETGAHGQEDDNEKSKRDGDRL